MLSPQIDNGVNISQWASCRIGKIAGCACAGNAGNVFLGTKLQRKSLVSDPGMHHGTFVMIANQRWRGKRSQHSRRMRTPQFYVSGKRTTASWFHWKLCWHWLLRVSACAMLCQTIGRFATLFVCFICGVSDMTPQTLDPYLVSQHTGWLLVVMAGKISGVLMWCIVHNLCHCGANDAILAQHTPCIVNHIMNLSKYKFQDYNISCMAKPVMPVRSQLKSCPQSYFKLQWYVIFSYENWHCLRSYIIWYWGINPGFTTLCCTTDLHCSHVRILVASRNTGPHAIP